MTKKNVKLLYDKANLYVKLIHTTAELINIMLENGESTGDLPLFLVKIEKNAQKCLKEIESLIVCKTQQ
jgi:hypothetical protein